MDLRFVRGPAGPRRNGKDSWPRRRSPSAARITAPGRCAAGCCARWPASISRSRCVERRPSTRAELLLLSPSFLVPCLTHDGVKVWDTLAIAEYLDELQPDAGLLPEDRAARAHCRSICGEMHSGFSNLRSALPMNLKARYPGLQGLGRRAGRHRPRDRDLARMPGRHGGPYLFGAKPCMADAMYAPVCTRFLTYDVKLDSACAAYCGHHGAAGHAGMDRRRQDRAGGGGRAGRGVLRAQYFRYCVLRSSVAW